MGEHLQWLLCGVGLGAGLAVGCSSSSPVLVCQEDAQCTSAGVTGFCEADGFCSTEDASCPSGRRYIPYGPGGDAGSCVDPSATGTGTGAGSGTTGPDPMTTVSDSDSTSSPITASSTATSSSSDPTTTSGPSDDSTTGPEPTSTSNPIDTTGGVQSTTSGVTLQTWSFGDRDDADFQQGHRDTCISADMPTSGMGNHADVHVVENGLEAVALLAFDVSGIEPGTQVMSAELQLSTQDTGTLPSGEIRIYELYEDWEEGEQNGAAGVANWTERFDGQPWTNEGAGPPGSRSSETMAAFEAQDADTTYSIDLDPQVVQAWVDDPATNYGIALTAVEFIDAPYSWLLSREYADPSVRPLLVVSVAQ